MCDFSSPRVTEITLDRPCASGNGRHVQRDHACMHDMMSCASRCCDATSVRACVALSLIHHMGQDAEGVAAPLLPATIPVLLDITYERRPGKWPQEAKRLLRLAVPISLASTLGYLERMITVAQVGRLPAPQLSAMSLAQTFFNITGLSLVIGIGSGLDTFCGQAHGAAQPELLGVLLQRGVVLSLITAVGPLVAWGWAQQQLLLLGQPAELAAPAATYIHIVSPALLLDAVTTCIVSFLSCQGLVAPVTLATLLVTLLVPGVNQLFIHVLGWELRGAAVGRVLLQLLRLLAQLVVVAWHNRRCPPGAKPWTGFSTEAFEAWGPYLALALPATAMMCLEWWASEALTLLAGLMPDASTAVAATGICFGISTLAFLMAYGIGAAAAIRVSNELGAGQHAGARAAVLLAIVVCQTLCSGLGAVLWLQPVFFARLFTTDAVIVDTVVACMPWVALELAGNGATVVVCGALRGAGRQLTGSCVNLVSYWCLGLPLGAYLGLVKGYGAPGLWMSLAAARLAQLVVLLGVLVWLDWEVEVAHSQQLIRSQSGSRVCSRQTSIDTSRPEAEGLLPHGRLGASMRLPETLPEERVWRAPVHPT